MAALWVRGAGDGIKFETNQRSRPTCFLKAKTVVEEKNYCPLMGVAKDLSLQTTSP